MSKTNRTLDLQVNGYDGVDFNADELDSGEVQRACQSMCKDGVAGILATVITNDIDAMVRRLSNICQVRESHQDIADIIWGIHIEGPFLNGQPGYIGAHPPHAARPADLDLMNRLLEAAGGLTKIVTLAPECDTGFQVTQELADQGIVVSAGHCNPTLDQLQGAIDVGLSMITHLGNGCPLEMHRHDNVIQRVLSLSDQLWIGFIADGVHVPFPALGNYLDMAGTDHSFVVTDAIEAAGRGPGTYRIGGQTVVVDEQLATWAEDKSHLVGSAMTMPLAIANLRNHLRLDAEQIDDLTRGNPSRAIGLPVDPI